MTATVISHARFHATQMALQMLQQGRRYDDASAIAYIAQATGLDDSDVRRIMHTEACRAEGLR